MKNKANEKTMQNANPSQSSSGVFCAVKKDGTPYYRASLTYQRKHISLGSFSDGKKAHEAYLTGKSILEDASIRPENYRSASALSFEKWICLINFRDNGIYFGTPIYVGKKMFFYYLTPQKILKFDLDDLFYYSSHKIMCRGNHLFVADYGSQISLLSRYGVKPYAKYDIDYRFRNGDTLDFRRENLDVSNVYHGVTKETRNGKTWYAVRIHIRGNYLVGRYADETEAAIAYNKAIDILKKNGLNKQFLPNELFWLSPSQYADLYTRISISPKIIAYKA